MLGVWKFLLSGILLQKDLSRLERIGTRRDAQETTKILECFQRISMVLADSLRSVQVVKGEMKRVC
jgi:hypothetical protein